MLVLPKCMKIIVVKKVESLYLHLIMELDNINDANSIPL